eukprot:4216966-Amphidinium_carterae.1
MELQVAFQVLAQLPSYFQQRHCHIPSSRVMTNCTPRSRQGARCQAAQASLPPIRQVLHVARTNSTPSKYCRIGY